MNRMQALLQHQGVLAHASHAHRVDPEVVRKFGRKTAATGNYFGPDKGAYDEARWLNQEARRFMSAHEGFALVEKQMTIIFHRKDEPDYLAYLNGARDFHEALSYLGHFVLGQSSEYEHWYEPKKKLVQFMYYTVADDTLKEVRHTMSYSEDKNKLYNVLDRFANDARRHDDVQASYMADALQRRVQALM
tara:strand:- start:111 stop:680 length:570 start_codon:yes stop_codon:yes gene_type:complete